MHIILSTGWNATSLAHNFIHCTHNAWHSFIVVCDCFDLIGARSYCLPARELGLLQRQLRNQAATAVMPPSKCRLEA